MKNWNDYPAAVLKAAPEQVDNALVDHYRNVDSAGLAQAYTAVAKGLAVVEEHPRGTLGASLRRHLNIIADERRNRGEEVL